MPHSYRGTLTKLGEEHWLQQIRFQYTTAENGSILRYFFRFPLQGMHGICCHTSVFLITPTPIHRNTLQEISIFQFADPKLRSISSWITSTTHGHPYYTVLLYCMITLR